MRRLAAILAAGTLLGGCSSGVSRFQDAIFTGSTPNQRAIIGTPANQPYPGDVKAQAAPLDGGYTGSVGRTAVTPVAVSPNADVARANLPPPGGSQPFQRNVAAAPTPSVKPLAPPVETARAAPPAVDAAAAAPRQLAAAEPLPAVRPAPVAVATSGETQEGWSRAGGTEVSAREGETVYNLSRRFGVPAAEIMKANGLQSGGALAAGQKVVIPTYVYSRKAPVSAPDANPNVAGAKSSRGSQGDAPAKNAPAPAPAPTDNVAVLPQSPKLKQRQAEPQETASAATPTPTPKPGAKAAVPAEKTAMAEKPAAAKAATGGGAYTVVSGDSLYGIARKTGVSAADLKAANGLSDGVLKIGQTLTVPKGGSVVAKAAPKVDPVTTSAVKNVAATEKAAVEKAAVTAYTPPRQDEKVISEAVTQTASIAPDAATGVGRMRWPVRGRVIADYGRSQGGKINDGIDIAVPAGTPVKAAENGVVIYAGDGLKEFGNTVLVRHEDGLVTVYGNASELKVSRGEKVKRGQEIARSGMSGSASSPQLHFEVRKDSAPVDPSSFLE